MPFLLPNQQRQSTEGNVTQTKFNQLAEENIHMIHQPAHKAYLSDIKVTNKSYT